MLIAGTGGVIFAALLVCAGCSGFSPDFDESAWHDRVTATDPKNLYAPHENDGKFFNPWMPMEEKSIGTLLRWRLAPAKDYTETEKTYLPPVVPDAVARIRATENKDFIFWVGHGTFFMRINGQYWLTDPIFSDRALLPKRKTPPGITTHEILAITDQVNCIISHNHYDHLDENSIRPCQTPPDSSCQKE